MFLIIFQKSETKRGAFPDWLFDPRTVRAIHVDSRYMLWVMEKVDNAQHIIDEMTVLR